MVSNRRRDTTPELEVRRAVHARGLRYRVDVPPLPDLRRRRADLVFRRVRVAVFIDGCFWHGCPVHGTIPTANAEYWVPKLRANRERDADTDRRLREAGWTVVRIWEHEDPESAADVIEAAVRPKQP